MAPTTITDVILSCNACYFANSSPTATCAIAVTVKTMPPYKNNNNNNCGLVTGKNHRLMKNSTSFWIMQRILCIPPPSTTTRKEQLLFTRSSTSFVLTGVICCVSFSFISNAAREGKARCIVCWCSVDLKRKSGFVYSIHLNAAHATGKKNGRRKHLFQQNN